jgi:hypothetical protein
VRAEELDIPFLQEGWTQDTLDHGLVQSYVESNTPKSGTVWIANQVNVLMLHKVLLNLNYLQTWGMEEINGDRRYMRHVKFTGPQGEDIEAKLVYDYR